jgi:LemA protein
VPEVKITRRMDMTTIIIILVLIAAAIVLYAISAYNGLINKRNKVANSWSQIDIQLKRRFDLIPNLLETVKGYAAHEKQTFEAVIQARNNFMSAGSHQDVIKANGELSQGLSRLLAVAEAYPELKSNTNFQELQRELTKTEDKITYARQFYNDVTMDYNNAVQMFPTSIFANRFNFVEEPFFTIDEKETAAPQIKF